MSFYSSASKQFNFVGDAARIANAGFAFQQANTATAHRRL
jgi:hypothetical protein